MIPVYVVGFLFAAELDRVVLIRKARPRWQRGLLNGVGGKAEQGESAQAAIEREFREEAGVLIPQLCWRHYLTLDVSAGASGALCHFLEARSSRVTDCHTVTDEPIEVHCLRPLPRDALYSLHWEIPLALDPVIRKPQRLTGTDPALIYDTELIHGNQA